MTQLPEAFVIYTRQLMGEERFERYMKAFEEETPVSIRLNPKKASPAPSTGMGLNYIRRQYLDLSGQDIVVREDDRTYSVTLPLL